MQSAGAQSSGERTNFQIACKTNPYYAFPFERQVKGIAGAGFRYIAWGNRYAGAGGERKELLAGDAPPAEAKRLAAICRDNGGRRLTRS